MRNRKRRRVAPPLPSENAFQLSSSQGRSKGPDSTTFGRKFATPKRSQASALAAVSLRMCLRRCSRLAVEATCKGATSWNITPSFALAGTSCMRKGDASPNRCASVSVEKGTCAGPI